MTKIYQLSVDISNSLKNQHLWTKHKTNWMLSDKQDKNPHKMQDKLDALRLIQEPFNKIIAAIQSQPKYLYVLAYFY